MRIQSTKDYDQFKKIVGNRSIDINHINYLVKLNSENNMLWQFPGEVTKDGYLWDGQHRLEAAKANDWEFYYTISDKTLAELSENIVAITNTAQKRWNVPDYIHFYASHDKAQYVFLQEMIQEYKLSHALVLKLVTGKEQNKEIKLGNLKLFATPEEKELIIELLTEYTSLRGTIASVMLNHSVFAGAMRTVFKDFSAKELKDHIERSPRTITSQRTIKDYLREFEEIINYRKHEKSYIRFF